MARLAPTHWKPERLRLRGVSLDAYRNETGFEQIAEALGIPYPARSRQSRSTHISATTRDSSQNLRFLLFLRCEGARLAALAFCTSYDDHSEKQRRLDGSAQRASSGGHQAR